MVPHRAATLTEWPGLLGSCTNDARQSLVNLNIPCSHSSKTRFKILDKSIKGTWCWSDSKYLFLLVKCGARFGGEIRYVFFRFTIKIA